MSADWLLSESLTLWTRVSSTSNIIVLRQSEFMPVFLVKGNNIFFLSSCSGSASGSVLIIWEDCITVQVSSLNWWALEVFKGAFCGYWDSSFIIIDIELLIIASFLKDWHLFLWSSLASNLTIYGESKLDLEFDTLKEWKLTSLIAHEFFRVNESWSSIHFYYFQWGFL